MNHADVVIGINRTLDGGHADDDAWRTLELLKP